MPETTPMNVNAHSAETRSGLKRWSYPLALTVLTLGTVAAYLVNLSANGWANSFYAAAVQAGSENWEALLFGSLDSANAITVDKPPASLWLMEISARIFDFSSFSMLLPQVLLAGTTVLLIVHSTRLGLRGHVSDRIERSAALGAGAIFAISPIVALMFRFNNPDALLVTLMAGAVLSAQHALRAVPRHSVRRIALWLILAGVCLGLGFLTKQFQVLLIVPGLALSWMLFARTSWVRRALWLLVPIAAMVGSAGWWIALVELIPAENRPYVGGSQSNSFLELTFGYNGFGRLTGDETGSVGGGGQGGGWGETGIARLFTGSFGQQIGWFFPTALILLAVIVVLLIRAGVMRRRSAGSSAGVRSAGAQAQAPGNLGAAVVLWGAWLVVTWLVLSNMNGIVHEYYTVALVPAIAVTIGLGMALLLNRPGYIGRLILAVVWALTGAWQFIISASMTGIPGALRWSVLAVSILGAVWIIATAYRRMALVLASILLALAILSTAAIPAQLGVRTIAGSAQGSLVTIAGTSSNTARGPGGGGGAPGNAPGVDGQGAGGTTDSESTHDGGPGGGGSAGGAGGLLNGAEPSDELTDLVIQNADEYTWVAAATGANQAAGYQLAAEEPVMSIGGFNGTDPSPTLEEFQNLVAEGQIHYYIGTGSNGPGGGPGGSSDGSSSSAEISEWVEANFVSSTVDSVSLYDLTGD